MSKKKIRNKVVVCWRLRALERLPGGPYCDRQALSLNVHAVNPEEFAEMSRQNILNIKQKSKAVDSSVSCPKFVSSDKIDCTDPHQNPSTGQIIEVRYRSHSCVNSFILLISDGCELFLKSEYMNFLNISSVLWKYRSSY